MRFCALQPCSRISVEHKDEGALTGLRRVQGISPSLDISSSRIGISTRPLTMSVPSKPYFHNEAAAFAHLEGVLWPNGRSALIAARSAASTMTLPRPALALASARIAASNWDRFCVGAYPAPPSSTGSLSHVRQQERAVSAQQVHRILGVTYKNAWSPLPSHPRSAARRLTRSYGRFGFDCRD